MRFPDHATLNPGMQQRCTTVSSIYGIRVLRRIQRQLLMMVALMSLVALNLQAQIPQPQGLQNPSVDPAAGDQASVDPAIVTQLFPLMENARNPLLELSTSEGELYLELFVDAAPASVRRILELTNQRYYDGLVFHRVVPGNFLQTGAVERAGRLRAPAMADEINARGLGLEQQPLLDTGGKPHPWLNIANLADFQQKVLLPLYRSMSISSSDQLAARQEQVVQRLQQMNLLQLHELNGYRYNNSLPSRRPLTGSVMLASYGPGTNDGELLLSLQDTPWLMGTHTVVGRIVSSLSLAASISRQPESSVRVYHIRQLDTSAAPAAATPMAPSSSLLEPSINPGV